MVESLATDIFEYHLYTSYQLGDLGYHAALGEVCGDGTSVGQRYAELTARHRSGPGLEAAERTFVEGFGRHQRLVGLKLRQLFQDQAVWSADLDLEAGTAASVTRFAQGIRRIRDSAGTPDEIKRIINRLLDPGTSPLVNFDLERLDGWAEAFMRWYRRNHEAVVTLMHAYPTQCSDWDRICSQLAFMVHACNHAGARYSLYPRTDNIIPRNKNAGIGNDLWLFYSSSVNLDAHVRNLPGQNVWRVNWASMSGRRPEVVAVNPMMRIWCSSNWAFPVTHLYAIAQETWTGDVQRARRDNLTFYGKGCVRPQLVSIYTPPGEDSAAFLLLQRTSPQYTGTQIDWFMLEWGRPSLLAESVVGTEMRYAYNVTRFVMDRGQLELLFKRDLGFPRKLHSLLLWSHYFISPLVLLFLLLLPFAAPLSSFAFLRPMVLFILLSYLIMEAVNVNDLLRHWRQTGSIWRALARTIQDAVLAAPFFLFLVPFFFRGIWRASNETFSFIRTQKNALLALHDMQRRWEGEDGGIMLVRTRRGLRIPLNGLLALTGMAGWGFAFFELTPIGSLVMCPYLLTALAFLPALYAFDTFVDRRGYLRGMNLWACFRMAPYAVYRTLSYLPVLGRPLLGLARAPGRLLEAALRTYPTTMGLRARVRFWPQDSSPRAVVAGRLLADIGAVTIGLWPLPLLHHWRPLELGGALTVSILVAVPLRSLLDGLLARDVVSAARRLEASGEVDRRVRSLLERDQVLQRIRAALAHLGRTQVAEPTLSSGPAGGLPPGSPKGACCPLSGHQRGCTVCGDTGGESTAAGNGDSSMERCIQCISARVSEAIESKGSVELKRILCLLEEAPGTSLDQPAPPRAARDSASDLPVVARRMTRRLIRESRLVQRWGDIP